MDNVEDCRVQHSETGAVDQVRTSSRPFPTCGHLWLHAPIYAGRFRPPLGKWAHCAGQDPVCQLPSSGCPSGRRNKSRRRSRPSVHRVQCSRKGESDPSCNGQGICVRTGGHTLALQVQCFLSHFIFGRQIGRSRLCVFLNWVCISFVAKLCYRDM